MAAAPKSWTASLRSARSIKPARSPEIRWLCAPVIATLDQLSAARHCTSALKSWQPPSSTSSSRISSRGENSRSGQLYRFTRHSFLCTRIPVNNYSDARKSDTKRYTQYFRNMLEQGVFLAPSQFEASFVSVAHTESDIDFAAKAAQDSLRQIANS